MKSDWRERARPIVEQVLKETAGKTEKEIRKALREAYPFGQRKHHPYKIWLDEIAVQRGKKKPKPKKVPYVSPNQLRLDYGND